VKFSPCFETLLAELEALLEQSSVKLGDVLEILKEIAPVLPGRSQDDYGRILVPGEDRVLRPISQVYFVDCKSDFRPETGIAAHPTISGSLARDLKIELLSSLELDQDDDDDDDDLQMGEDFTTRVEGILKEHNISGDQHRPIGNRQL
jgi:hypothetical protein